MDCQSRSLAPGFFGVCTIVAWLMSCDGTSVGADTKAPYFDDGAALQTEWIVAGRLRLQWPHALDDQGVFLYEVARDNVAMMSFHEQ